MYALKKCTYENEWKQDDNAATIAVKTFYISLPLSVAFQFFFCLTLARQQQIQSQNICKNQKQNASKDFCFFCLKRIWKIKLISFIVKH